MSGDLVSRARLDVLLTPRASREAVVVPDEVPGADGQGAVLRVRVTAAPVDGRANQALVRLLAKRLRVARGAVRLVSGQASRRKSVEVDGLTVAEVLQRLR